jgi:putative transposase
MTNYRRSRIAGASYFCTVNLADRSQALLTEHIGLLRSAFEYTRERHPFIVDAIVVLPEHMPPSGRCLPETAISRYAGG